MSEDLLLPDRPAMPPVHRSGLPRLSPAQWVALDVALVVLAAILGKYTPPIQPLKYSGTLPQIVAYTSWFLVSVGFLFRRRYPRATLATLVVLLFLIQCLRSSAPASDYLAFALYSVVITSQRRAGMLITAGVVTVAVVGVIVGGGDFVSGFAIGATLTICAGWLVGEYTRNARNYASIYAALVADKAAAAEERRIEQVNTAVAQERVKLARELHDVVAHAMSVIAVRAGVARVVLDTQPEQAREALGIIETTTRRALQEMRLLVGVLRGDTDSKADLQPVPGLKDLPLVITDAQIAHVSVDLVITGQVRPLPPAIDLSAYRIVQEALTNAVRHAGPTTAHVTLDYHPHEIRIEIRDDGPPPGRTPDRVLASQSTGHGLIGIRERAALFGGTFTAGPLARGYRVSANLHTGDLQDPKSVGEPSASWDTSATETLVAAVRQSPGPIQ
jgi:signal transduction histidine kinase